MFNKKCNLLCAALLGSVCLSGCREISDEEKELAAFSASVSDFADYIKEADRKINGLDVNQKESADELLQILDDMDAEFARFAALEVPDQYKGVGDLADEASENMSLAVSYYHSAYEAETFDINYADAAYQYYERVMMRIDYMGRILSGEEIPENDDIIIYEESDDSSILDKWLSDDQKETASETAPEAVE